MESDQQGAEKEPPRGEGWETDCSPSQTPPHLPYSRMPSRTLRRPAAWGPPSVPVGVPWGSPQKAEILGPALRGLPCGKPGPVLGALRGTQP